MRLHGQVGEDQHQTTEGQVPCASFTDDVADRMIERYKGIASRLVIYLASHWREVDPKILERWSEVARAVRKAG